jgi:hypothetical protein
LRERLRAAPLKDDPCRYGEAEHKIQEEKIRAQNTRKKELSLMLMIVVDLT